MQFNASTYQQYLNLVASNTASNIKEESKLIIARFKEFAGISNHIAPTTFLVDYSRKKYVYLEDTCLSIIGNPAKYYYKEGLKGFWDQTHPVDFAIINEKVFPYNINFIKTKPNEKYSDFVFSHNFRMYKPGGELVNLLQRSSFVPGSINGTPAGVIGFVFDITHFKNDTTIVHTIEETTIKDNKLLIKPILKKIYPIDEHNGLSALSKKEIEILKMIANGNSSKQIAAELQISVNTINNHRKNILAKTNGKNIAALIKYGISQGLI